MRRCVWAVCGLLAASPAWAGELNPGDPAPELKVGKYLKGEPVARFEPGRVYVVEFWATWCGPCVAGVPKLTELQKKYPDITVIAVGVWETAADGGAEFVRGKGDAIGYRVATDSVPAGKDAQSGHMAEAWLGAAGLSSIPAAFVVGKTGRVDWIGHPDTLADAVPLARAGKLDTDANRKALAAKRKKDKDYWDFRAAALAAVKAKDAARLRGVYAGYFAAYPDAEGSGKCCMRVAELLKVGEEKEAVEYGERCVETLIKDSDGQLQLLALYAADAMSREPVTNPVRGRLALKALDRADALSKPDGYRQFLRGCASAACGDYKAACELLERAIAQEPQSADIYRPKLDSYRSKLKGEIKK